MTEFLYRKYFCDGNTNMSCKNDLVPSKHFKGLYESKKSFISLITSLYFLTNSVTNDTTSPDIELVTERNLYYPGSDSALVYNNKIYITGIVLQKVNSVTNDTTSPDIKLQDRESLFVFNKSRCFPSIFGIDISNILSLVLTIAISLIDSPVTKTFDPGKGITGTGSRNGRRLCCCF